MMMDFLNSPNILLLGTLFKMESINNNYMIIIIILYTVFNYIFETIDTHGLRSFVEKKTKKIFDLYFPNNTVSIELTTHTVTHCIGYSDKVQKKKIYSLDFIALLDYTKSINITKRKEILTTQLKDTSWQSRFNEDTNEDNRYQLIPSSEYYEDPLISNEHKIYLRMNKIKNLNEEKNDEDNSSDLTAKIYCYYDNDFDKNKKIKILNDYLLKIKQIYLDKVTKKDDKQYIYVYQKTEDIDDVTKLIYSEHINKHNKTFKNVFIEDKEKLKKYISKFKIDVNSDIIEEYKTLGIPYKAGMLFWGKPGTGKTSTIKAILKETKRHGIIINLSNISSNKELENVFRNRKINNKTYESNQLCFILEDCDATKLSSIKERQEQPKVSIIDNNNDKSLTSELKNIIAVQEKSFDLSCFLNILDGIIELYGVMIIVTTNHPEKLDEALIRPGRIDFKYEFKNSSKQIIIEMLKLKFKLYNDDFLTEYKEYFDQIKDYIISPAEIQCILSQNDNIKQCIIDIKKKMEI